MFHRYFIIITYKIKKFLASFVCIFIASKTARRRVRNYISYFTWNKIFVQKIHYDCVISMGEACFVAIALKSANLRTCSGPFDWMYGSTFKKRFDIFLNGFERYFDKSDLDFDGFSKDSNKDIYTNRYTGLSYNHDFSLRGNFDSEYPIVKEKYDRRISRLMKKLKDGKKILIVYAETQGAIKSSQENIINLLAKANQVYGNKIDLVYLRNNFDLKPWEYKQVIKSDHLLLIDYLGSEFTFGSDIINEHFIKRNLIKILSFAKITKNQA